MGELTDANLVGIMSCNARLRPIFAEIADLAEKQKEYGSDTPEYEAIESHLRSARARAERAFYLYHPELKESGTRKNAVGRDSAADDEDDPELAAALADIAAGRLAL